MSRRDYRQTVDWLYERLPMFSRLGKAAIKSDLINIIKLCNALGNPEHKFKSIHIAGTNGKGSTSHALAAVLQKAGYKTGLYTSPHLIDFRERIRIDGAAISEIFVIEFVEKHEKLIEEIQPSFFEITVAMAFLAFAYIEVDVAIIETGLGGRLDSTNIITPELSIITNISLDHTDILGTTIEEIAFEKAGIIKPYVPALIGEEDERTYPVFLKKSILEKSPLYTSSAFWELIRTDGSYTGHYRAVDLQHQKIYELQTDLYGSYQSLNLRTTLAAVSILQSLGWNLDLDESLKALSEIKKLTGLRGRWEIMQEDPFVVVDVGHNAAGISGTVKQFEKMGEGRMHIVMGFVRDKDISAILSLLPNNATYYFTQADIPRALPVGELAALAIQYGLKGNSFSSVKEAIQQALADLKKEDRLLITGSFFIAGEALTFWDATAN